MIGASWFRRNVVYPLWITKDRSPRLKYARDLERTQYMPPEKLRELQNARLAALLEYAYSETAHYRRTFDAAGFDPRSFRDERDLKRIPILNKDELRDRPTDFLASSMKGSRFSSFKTGGSTGVPVEILKDPTQVEMLNATALRVFGWAGWKRGEPVGMIWGNPSAATTLKEKLRRSLIEPVIYLDTMRLTDATMRAFVDDWRRVKPTLLRGHSHSIYIFASFCKQAGIDSVRPNAIISSSMMLLPTERRVIEDTFRCKVTDLYGCEEVGLIACECEQHDGMHIDADNLYVEVIDPASGADAAPGQDGAVIVSSLLNRSMPVIRYKMGDVASLPGRSCKCGRTLPLMNNISGRVADFLVRKDGSVVAGVSLVERTLTKFPGIAQMQIVQEDLDTLIIKIAKNPGFDADTEQALVEEFRRSVGEHNDVRIEFVPSIPQEQSGKYRFAISKVRNPFG